MYVLLLGDDLKFAFLCAGFGQHTLGIQIYL